MTSFCRMAAQNLKPATQPSNSENQYHPIRIVDMVRAGVTKFQTRSVAQFKAGCRSNLRWGYVDHRMPSQDSDTENDSSGESEPDEIEDAIL